MSAVMHAGAITIAQVQVDSKTNEIKALPHLLDEFAAPGAVFTMDAMHAQTNAARLIVEQKQADYFVTVKDNQPTLKDAIATHPWLDFSPCRPIHRQGSWPPRDQIAASNQLSRSSTSSVSWRSAITRSSTPVVVNFSRLCRCW